MKISQNVKILTLSHHIIFHLFQTHDTSVHATSGYMYLFVCFVGLLHCCVVNHTCAVFDTYKMVEPLCARYTLGETISFSQSP